MSNYEYNLTTIKIKIKHIKNTEFNYKIIIKELAFLNLKTESILFDRNPQE